MAMLNNKRVLPFFNKEMKATRDVVDSGSLSVVIVWNPAMYQSEYAELIEEASKSSIMGCIRWSQVYNKYIYIYTHVRKYPSAYPNNNNRKYQWQ